MTEKGKEQEKDPQGRRKLFTDAAKFTAVSSAALPLLSWAKPVEGFSKIERVQLLKNETRPLADGKEVEIEFQGFAADGASDVIRSYMRYVYAEDDRFYVFGHSNASHFGPENTFMIAGVKGGNQTVTMFDASGHAIQVTQPAIEREKLYPGLSDEERMNLYLREKRLVEP